MFGVLAFTIKPIESADSRYRILQYEHVFETAQIQIDHRSFMGPRYFRWQIENSHAALRSVLYPLLWIRRLFQVLFLAPKYGAVWVSREMAPLGPPILEQLLVRGSKRVILDIDDALHIADKRSSSLIPRLLRDRSKYARMAKSYTAVVCGNHYLANYYQQWSSNVHVIPTVVDAERYAAISPSSSGRVRIGWIGTPLNRHHLEGIRPALTALAHERSFELVVVGLNEPLDWDLPYCRFVKWSLAAELEFFSSFDIGIMPLENSPFARGKCAFKLIQYMAAGLPVVASPIGANQDVVSPGKNGYLADTQDQWCSTLSQLIENAQLRQQLGENGRDFVRRQFSLEASWRRYAEIIRGAPLEQAGCAS